MLAAEAHIWRRTVRATSTGINRIAAMNYGLRLTPGELRRSQNCIGSAGCTLNEAREWSDGEGNVFEGSSRTGG